MSAGDAAAQDEQVYDAAAAALARLELPDLSEFPEGVVAFALARAFEPFGPDEAWLRRLRDRVSELSGGRVELRSADPDRFPYRIKDPSTSYQELVTAERSQLLVIGPFSPPLQFMDPPTTKGTQ